MNTGAASWRCCYPRPDGTVDLVRGAAYLEILSNGAYS